MRSPAVSAATMEQRAGPSGTDTGLVDMLCVSLREHEGGYMHALTQCSFCPANTQAHLPIDCGCNSQSWWRNM